jgi:hypothetical protein
MSETIDKDLESLRRMWEERRSAARAILERIDTRGMTRPARDPEERAWLDEHDEGGFIEDEAAARAARVYYERRYNR